MAKKETAPKEEEVQIELDEKGVPVWKDADGLPIKGLPRELFTNEEIEPADKKLGRIAYLEYQNALKEQVKLSFVAKTARLDELIQKNNDKIQILTHGESEEMKKDRLRESLLKRHRAVVSQLKDMGVDPANLDDLDDEEED